MLGFAVGQLFYGPLSDRYGRRPVLLGGLVFFTAATFGCSFAPSIGGLIGLRILQGLGAASGSVLGRALTRDAYTFQEMPLVMSWISLGQNIAPSLAPTLGGFLGEWLGWRATFWFVGGFGIAPAAWSRCSACARPTTIAATASISASLLRGSGEMLRDRQLPRQRADARLRLRHQFRHAGRRSLHPAGQPGLLAARVRPDRAAVGRAASPPAPSSTTGWSAACRRSPSCAPRAGSTSRLCRSWRSFRSRGVVAWWAIVGPHMVLSFGTGMIVANANAGAVGLYPRLAGTAVVAGRAGADGHGRDGHGRRWRF